MTELVVECHWREPLIVAFILDVYHFVSICHRLSQIQAISLTDMMFLIRQVRVEIHMNYLTLAFFFLAMW